MLSRTSLSTAKLASRFRFESCRVTVASLEAISPQVAAEVPRCGVPRNIIVSVRLCKSLYFSLRLVLHLQRALNLVNGVYDRLCLMETQTSLTTIPPKEWAMKIIGRCIDDQLRHAYMP